MKLKQLNKKNFKISISIFLISLALLSCGGLDREKEKVIATINGEPIYVKDFNRALALNLKRDPLFRVTPQTLENEINMLIDKRLLIQEAKKEKLDQTDLFVSTIQTFWEQTLIRDLITYKDKEFDKIVDKTGRGIEKDERDQRKTELFNSWLNEVRKNADIKINNDVLKGLKYTSE